MTVQTQTTDPHASATRRSASSPAYYLGRPAEFWRRTMRSPVPRPSVAGATTGADRPRA